MKLFNENHHVSRALDDLIRVVVGGRKHRDGTRVDAARNEREILGLIVFSALLFLSAARSATRFCPSAVSRGSLPSGGSMIIDVRKFGVSKPWVLSSPNCEWS